MASGVEVDLHRETLGLLANHTFRGPIGDEKKILLPMGYDTFIPTKAETLFAVVAEKPDYFWGGEQDYIKNAPGLRDYVPPPLIVALRSGALLLDKSVHKSQLEQLKMHEAESRVIQKLLPDARNIMLPAATLVQLALVYFMTKGQKLFKGVSVRALDEVSKHHVVDVGREGISDRLIIGWWGRSSNRVRLGTLSALVFIDQ